MPTNRINIYTACLLLAMTTTTLYWPTLGFPFISYDDSSYLLNNPHVKGGLSWSGLIWSFTTFHEANWHPLTWLSHQADVSIFGLWSGGHHLINIIIHTCTAILLLQLLWKLTGRLMSSVMVASLFALHPLHVESVAWTAQRKDLLCAFFTILTIHAYTRYTSNHSNKAYGIAIVLFSASLMSKPMAVTTPLVLLLMDFWPLERTMTKRFSLLTEKIPFFALSVVSSVITLSAQKAGGAINSINNSGIISRTENAIVSVSIYIAKTFWPTGLSLLYPFPASIPAWKVAAASALLAAMITTAFMQRNLRPYLCFGITLFLVMLLPVSGLIKVGHLGMADRYTYLPLTGVFIAVVWFASDVSQGWKHQRLILVTACSAILACCIIVSSNQISYWKNSESIFRRSIAVTKGNYPMLLNLGDEMKRQGRIEEAIMEYRKAIIEQPDNADAHCYLADALHSSGRLGEAVLHYNMTLQIDPSYAEAHNNLGSTLVKLGKTGEAIKHFIEALRINPGDPVAKANLQAARLLLTD